MTKEAQARESRDHWRPVLRSNLPANTKTILSTWSFKRKRFPGGRLLSYKSCLYVHGCLQKWGVDYWETYSPIVKLISVRLLLYVSLNFTLN